MKSSARIGLKALLGLSLISAAVLGTSSGTAPATAPHVDLSRYGGRWYTIASLPAWFERGCAGSTTDYTLLQDGQLKIVNACHKGSLDGPVKKFEGKAWVVDHASNSKLKVKFGWFITSDFWIFDVSPDYSRAIIGTPNGGYMWILSRTPTMDDATYQHMLAKAADKGLDTTRLQKIQQPTPGQATASR